MLNTAARPEPRFLPTDPRPNPVQALVRLATAHCLAAHRGPGYRPGPILREYWPRDTVAMTLFERSASAPATTTVTGWAAEVAATAVTAFIASLKDSAAAVLITRAPKVDLTGAARVNLPSVSAQGGASQ